VLALSGTLVVDAAITVTVIEVIALLALRSRTGRGIAPRALLANAGAGLALMVAVRAALVGAAWPLIAACLAAAGLAHAIDLAGRWPRR
jgi:hypothetical protein